MKHWLLVSALSLFTASAFSGILPGEKAVEAAPFEEVDTDQDGTISRQEASAFAALELVFERTDRNGDGRIDTQEYAEANIPVKMQ